MESAPFISEPHEAFKTKERFRELTALANGKAMVTDYERKTRVVQTQLVDLDNPGAQPRVMFTRNERDAYHDPGQPVLKTLPDGRTVVLQAGDSIFLTGTGASPSGDKPFLDRLEHHYRSNRSSFSIDGSV